MKLTRLMAVVLMAVGVQMAAAQKIKGSDTVLPVSQEAAETYMNSHPGARVTVTGGGSGVGISALLDGTTDIAMASRSIKFSERMKLKKGGKQFVGQTINVKCTKSKLTKPFQECSLDMVYDDLGVARFDAVGSTVNYLIEQKKIATAGPRVVWTDGKNYWRKDLIEKITNEGGLEVLTPLLG